MDEREFGPLPDQESALSIPDEMDGFALELEIAATDPTDTERLLFLQRQLSDYWYTRAHVNAGRLLQLENRINKLYKIAADRPNMWASTLLSLFEVTP